MTQPADDLLRRLTYVRALLEATGLDGFHADDDLRARALEALDEVAEALDPDRLAGSHDLPVAAPAA